MVGEREERRKVLIEWGGRRNRWIHKRKWLVTLVSFYFCEKNNWVLKCTKYIEDNTFVSKQTIEIGRKDLNFLLVRDSKHKETRKETRDFKYNGKCKVIEENQF